ncbi:hypothetical protein V8F20_003134 [Naviculisporaceae sp. PSN 640]
MVVTKPFGPPDQPSEGNVLGMEQDQDDQADTIPAGGGRSGTVIVKFCRLLLLASSSLLWADRQSCGISSLSFGNSYSVHSNLSPFSAFSSNTRSGSPSFSFRRTPNPARWQYHGEARDASVEAVALAGTANDEILPSVAPFGQAGCWSATLENVQEVDISPEYGTLLARPADRRTAEDRELTDNEEPRRSLEGLEELITARRPKTVAQYRAALTQSVLTSYLSELAETISREDPTNNNRRGWPPLADFAELLRHLGGCG